MEQIDEKFFLRKRKHRMIFLLKISICKQPNQIIQNHWIIKPKQKNKIGLAICVDCLFDFVEYLRFLVLPAVQKYFQRKKAEKNC